MVRRGYCTIYQRAMIIKKNRITDCTTNISFCVLALIFVLMQIEKPNLAHSEKALIFTPLLKLDHAQLCRDPVTKALNHLF
ncbi:hypothetical protein I3843_15G105800 [Carya illinoinensis]|nr:hypothetical protein I3843_15G105800 [Carya illinoinensis]